MIRSWLGVLAFVAVAAGLFVGLTHFGQETDTFYRDHPSHFTRSSPGRLILPPLSGHIFSSRCAASSPCKARRITVFRGLYARGPVPPEVAQIGGVAVPLFLLSVAGYLALQGLRGMWHIIAALPLFIFGLIFLLPLVGSVYLDTHYQRYIPNVSLLRDLTSPLLLSTTTAAGMLLSGVVWIGIDTFRGRQNKQ
ncbi:MAG TPA: hypothetical protein VGF97_00735 [Rhizomicrobium sp.]|jgi:hypothetical protein